MTLEEIEAFEARWDNADYDTWVSNFENEVKMLIATAKRNYGVFPRTEPPAPKGEWRPIQIKDLGPEHKCEIHVADLIYRDQARCRTCGRSFTASELMKNR